MSGAGSALMGTGSSRGDDRAVAAAEWPSDPLLEASIDGAHGVLLSIQGGSDLGCSRSTRPLSSSPAPLRWDAKITLGAVIDDALGDQVRVTVIAAGLGREPQRPGRRKRRVRRYRVQQHLIVRRLRVRRDSG